MKAVYIFENNFVVDNNLRDGDVRASFKGKLKEFQVMTHNLRIPNDVWNFYSTLIRNDGAFSKIVANEDTAHEFTGILRRYSDFRKTELFKHLFVVQGSPEQMIFTRHFGETF